MGIQANITVKADTNEAEVAIEKLGEASVETATKVVSLKAEMRKLKEELQKVPEGTKEYEILSQKIAKIKDKIDDANESVKQFTGEPLERLNSSLSFTAGKLMDLDFGGAVTGIKGMAGAVKDVKLKDMAEGVKNVGGAFLQLGKALLTNPLFLIAGTLALIAMNFEKIIKFFPSLDKGLTGLTEAEREMAKASKDRADASEKAYQNIDKQSNILKMQGKSERDILEMKIKALGVAIQDRKAQLTIQQEQAKIQVETARRNREILDGIIQFITAPLQVLLGSVDMLGKAIGKDFGLREGMNDFLGDLVIDPDEQEKKLNEEIKKSQEALQTMENDYAGLQLSLRDMDKKASDDKKKQAEENAKAQKEIDDKALKEKEANAKKEYDLWKAVNDAKKQNQNEFLDALEKENEDYYRSTLSKKDQEILDVQDKYFQLIAQAEQYNYDTEELERHKAEAIAKIEATARLEKDAKDKEQDDKDIARAQELQDAKFRIAQTATQGMMDLSELLVQAGIMSAEKGFKVQKALAITEATISTIQGVVNALTAKSTIPEPFGSIAKGVTAGSVAIAGALNIAKIKATKFDKGGGGGGGGGMNSGGGGGAGGGASAPQSASAPMLDLSFLNNSKTKPQPLQAYVVSSHVESSLEAQNKINEQIRIK